MRKLSLLLVLMLFSAAQLLAQRTITGTVRGDDGQTLPSVTVLVNGDTKQAAQSDIDGKYSIKVPANGKFLRFSFVGMKTEDIAITASNVINVELTSEAKQLEGVVITGYGVTKKAAFTGAATTVDQKKILEKTEVNPIKALEATVPGLQMSSGSGQPGAPSTIFIRGRSSVNSGTQPLYVIDGVPMEAGNWGMRSNEGQQFTPLADLNPADIETMTILKDATATSIYGSRAANGVIVITTKKAKSGARAKVSYDVKLGWSEMPSFTDKYKIVNKDKHLELQYEGTKNSGWYGDTPEEAKAGFWDEEKAYGITEATAANVNWLDAVTRKGLFQEHNLSVTGSGTTETSPKYYMSIGYTADEAIIIGKDFSKLTFRLNLDQSPLKWLQYGITSSLSHSKTNMGSGGGYFSDPITQAYTQSPLTPIYKANGDWNFTTINKYNPVAQRSEYGDKSTAKNYKAILTPYVTVKILPELTFTSKLGVDFMSLDEFGYWSFLQPQGKDMKGMGEAGATRQTMITVNNIVNYIKTFNSIHNVNFMLGQEAQNTYQYTTYLSGSNFPVPDKNKVSLAATPSGASTNEYELKLASFFANAQYDYDGKYYLSSSFRYDGSSRFGSNHKWAPFWSIGAKYRITREDFMKDITSWLTDLTLRTSYGTSGNQEVGGSWYAAMPLFGYGWNYNQNGGSAREQVGNPDLKWEQIGKFNVGIDVNFINRISLTFDYYRHLTTDMVFNMPLSRTTGMSSMPKNIGKMENKGIEISLNAKIFNDKNFTWDFTAVASHNKNIVKKLSTDLPIVGTYTIIEPGKDIYTFKMKEYAGVDPQTGTALWYRYDTGSITTGNYNLAAKRYLGAASPKLQGSITNSFTLYSFDLSIQLNYSLGGKVYGSNLRYDEQTGNSFDGPTTNYVYDNRWKRPGDVTDVPIFKWGATTAASHSSRYLMDGDYLKIQSIVLGYTIPSNLTSKIKISKARLYATASNLYTFTSKNYRGFDPAGIDPNGIQWWNYPQARKIIFGLNVNF